MRAVNGTLDRIMSLLSCFDHEQVVYRTDQNDEADGLSESAAPDGDHIVVRTNGTSIEVHALEGGSPFQVTHCQPGCSP